MTARLDAQVLACLERTRASVVNIMMGIGAGIALTGAGLRFLDPPAHSSSLWLTRRVAYSSLFALILGSYACRRIGLSRKSLRDSETRCARYFRSRVIAASVGAVAIPVGAVYGYAVEPRIQGVGPFWVVALGLGVLSVPRARELEGFDESITNPTQSG